MNSKPPIKEIVRQYSFCVMGGLIFAAGMNIFILPSHFFSGTLTGIAQIIQIILSSIIKTPANLTGVLLFILNIPLIILSFKVINRRFLFKTIITIIAQSFAMMILPIPQVPLINNALTICIIGGFICGFGAGLSLKSGGSGGGVDVIGVYCSIKFENFSVGKISILISMIVYCYAFFIESFEIIIYSILFTVTYSFVMDKVHYQNIKVIVWIITKSDNTLKFINLNLRRNATYWQGTGSYSGSTYLMIMTIISKQELSKLKNELSEIDPNAFLVESNQVNVMGNFEKRFF